MNVVLVMDQFDDSNNGTTVTARRLAESLRSRGHRVTILAGGKPAPDKICAKRHVIPFFQPVIESQGMCFAKPDPQLYFEAFKDADIVHLFLPFRFCREAMRHAYQMGVPCVAAFHLQPENITSTLFLERFRFANDWLYHYFYRRFYRHFSHIHCPSDFIAGQLHAHNYAARTHSISNGVDRAFKKIEVKRPAEFEGKIPILMVGRLSREKRQDLVIEAAKRSRYAEQIQLVFAGKGPRKNSLRRKARGLKNPPIFSFYQQGELIELINSCDLYIHASDAEIEGISCLEAMACGLVPVISDSSLSATGQYALHENSLFAAGNAADLAEKIDYWLEHPEEKARLSLAYQEQQELNRVDICMAKIERLYETVIHEDISPIRRRNVKRKAFTPNPEKLLSRIKKAETKKCRGGHILAKLIVNILWPLHKLFFGFRAEGLENLRLLEGGAVTVSNHVHHLDCTMIGSKLLSRHSLWLVSMRENFNIPFIGALIKAIGAVSLGNDTHDLLHLTKLLTKRLDSGDLVHYYPEGMLVPYHEDLRPLHPGAFSLAVRAGAPVLPMVLRCEKRGGLYRLKRRPCFTLHILPPEYANRNLGTKRAREDLQARVEAAMLRALRGLPPDSDDDRLPRPEAS